MVQTSIYIEISLYKTITTMYILNHIYTKIISSITVNSPRAAQKKIKMEKY